MATTRSQKLRKEPQQSETAGGSGTESSSAPSPPPTFTIFLVYSVLGLVLSYTFGRDPSGTAVPYPDNCIKELAPTIIVICLFLVSYSLLDVMEVGSAKLRHGLGSKTYPSVASNPPEEVYLAQRIQTNQVEQLPGFLVGSICFSILVNGKVGALLSLIWAVLRRMYASTYRASIGKPISKSGVTKFTIPAYFVLNAMLMGAAVQCVRYLL
mmetsp:Transcript_7802/g.12225  ORF Transcript_7802/g.12225 Transcript_7802/m.12225 type:complete len:211 (+) Transcript_7802:102-734(+)|eukprot:CAMPEP_0194224380 /NCGR_PEP_ID=MMETSP0156-20130528/37309_1 /TAXON_ID=33649 /ORGANISM="Thalassionema nitzschioides, Strain L26-B" /LENGTH=210 /DNA_ID=CAMNT_0038955917 /DNA_START=54 /DNA_END=686 /DNA_ORIENTATION=-